MLVNYRSNLFERYGISEEEFKEKLDNMEVHVLGVSIEALAALELISVKRGCLKKGAEPDFARSSKLIVDEFRAGRLGRISLQRPKV